MGEGWVPGTLGRGLLMVELSRHWEVNFELQMGKPRLRKARQVARV